MKLEAIAFLAVEAVEGFHEAVLEAHGGLAGVRDRGLLEAAVARPSATFGGAPLYPSLATMAAVTMVAIARNHPFLDGNKRTAFVAGLAFLETNGHALTLGVAWVNRMVLVAEGRLDVEALAELLAAEMGGDVDVEP